MGVGFCTKADIKVYQEKLSPAGQAGPNCSVLDVKVNTDFLKIAPGPGAYSFFSEFGQYESKHAKEFERKLSNKSLGMGNRSASAFNLKKGLK